MENDKKAKFLLSQETLTGYGLDYVFQCSKDIGFDGIDLALRKNFDARNSNYVSKLSEKYDMPVKIIQVSNKVNRREMDTAVSLAHRVGAEVICINAPLIYQIDVYRFIKDNIKNYKRHNKGINFCIINPPKSNFFALPIPKFYFSNIVEVIKKLKSNIAFDVSHIDENVLESTFMRKMSNFIPYIGVVYLSDKDKTGKMHQPLGSGVLKLPSILKKFKQNEFYNFFSLKLDIEKKDLADMEKVEQILKKCKLYFKENYQEITVK